MHLLRCPYRSNASALLGRVYNTRNKELCLQNKHKTKSFDYPKTITSPSVTPGVVWYGSRVRAGRHVPHQWAAQGLGREQQLIESVIKVLDVLILRTFQDDQHKLSPAIIEGPPSIIVLSRLREYSNTGAWLHRRIQVTQWSRWRIQIFLQYGKVCPVGSSELATPGIDIVTTN